MVITLLHRQRPADGLKETPMFTAVHWPIRSIGMARVHLLSIYRTLGHHNAFEDVKYKKEQACITVYA